MQVVFVIEHLDFEKAETKQGTCNVPALDQIVKLILQEDIQRQV